MININKLISEYLPQLEKKPKFKKTLAAVLKKLLREDEINEFLNKNNYLGPYEFLDNVMHRLGLSFTVDNWQLENIPAEGKVIIVANHPLGSLDGIALLKLVSQVRNDFKIVINEILNQLDPLTPFFLPINAMSEKSSKEQYRAIEDALEQGQAVIFFPAGEVSRFRLMGIKDCHWRTSFLHLARKFRSPILPVHVGGKNSRFFYGLSLLAKPVGMLLLVKEMFRKTQVKLPITIGEIIPFRAIENLPPNERVSAQLFRKHVYALATGKKLVFDTEKPIAHPQSRQLLKSELESNDLLMTTRDGKQIFLLEHAKDTALLGEIGRLREVSFRAVGEGTGERIDLDEYDPYYQHIVLWDPEALELVGAYRVLQTADMSTDKLYSSTLFQYREDFSEIKWQGLELGRSFVQPKYWGKRSLDYLWYGIGAYLSNNKHIRFLFGPVSISAEYTQEMMEWMIYYYQMFYGAKKQYAIAFKPFRISKNSLEMLDQTFADSNSKDGFKKLKYQLMLFNKSVPTLLKQYTELCKEGGVCFADFNIDPLFNNCVDGLVIIDVDKLLERKRARYLLD